MGSFRLALSFIRIPRLFGYLLLWPLALGFIVAAIQVSLTIAYVKAGNMGSDDIEKRFDNAQDGKFIQTLVYGSRETLPPIKTCRWESRAGGEVLPAGCELNPLDVTIQVPNPETFDERPYTKLYNHAAYRLHLCRHCESEITLSVDNDLVESNYYSIRGYAVELLREMLNPSGRTDMVKLFQTLEDKDKLLGEMYLHPAGFRQPIHLSHLESAMAIIVDIGFLVVLTLWLALRAHRRVLDYFARSNALLPLVAACGKRRFYNALWIITLARVVLFLLATVPMTYLMHVALLKADVLSDFSGNSWQLLIWLLGISSSLAAIALIASIGELKHRTSLVSFLYNYLPMIIFIIGSAIWAATIFSPGPISAGLQHLITVLPVLGTAPIILQPLIRSDPALIVGHIVLSVFISLLLLRFNSRWFAAHLEEI